MDDKELLVALDNAARAREAKGQTPTTYLHVAAARLRELAADNEVLRAECRAWRGFANAAEDSTWAEAWKDHGHECCAAEVVTDASKALEKP